MLNSQLLFSLGALFESNQDDRETRDRRRVWGSFLCFPSTGRKELGTRKEPGPCFTRLKVSTAEDSCLRAWVRLGNQANRLEKEEEEEREKTGLPSWWWTIDVIRIVFYIYIRHKHSKLSFCHFTVRVKGCNHHLSNHFFPSPKENVCIHCLSFDKYWTSSH